MASKAMHFTLTFDERAGMASFTARIAASILRMLSAVERSTSTSFLFRYFELGTRPTEFNAAIARATSMMRCRTSQNQSMRINGNALNAVGNGPRQVFDARYAKSGRCDPRLWTNRLFGFRTDGQRAPSLAVSLRPNHGEPCR